MAIPSSFNGCEFYIREILEQGYNNRAVLHDIVNGKYGPYVEVMGRGPEIYEVDGFVSYNSGTYFDKEILRQQVMQSKKGQFMHPELGLKTCAVLNFSMKEDARQKGVVNIRIELCVINNQHYSIGKNSSGGLMGLVQRASSLMGSVSLDGIGTSCLSVMGAGEGIIKSISGVDPLLNDVGQTLGRFYQAGNVGAGILNSASTLTEAISQTTDKTSQITAKLQ